MKVPSNGRSSEHGHHAFSQKLMAEAPLPLERTKSRYDTNFLDDENLSTKANRDAFGRIDIQIEQKNPNLAKFIPKRRPTLPASFKSAGSVCKYALPTYMVGEPQRAPPPPLSIVIHVVGSRGDVQPFIALAKALKENHGHRVRLATHAVFKDFVEENEIEFFNIGGQPSELMQYMVKNPGLLPSFETIKHGDVGRRRKEIEEMLNGCWRSCIESGNGMDDATPEDKAEESVLKPFIADAIIANPPSFAFIHCAEKLGVPLHMMFTMPAGTPTTAFPHPLANVQSSNTDCSTTNYLTYPLVESITWQGLGDIFNKFRVKTLGLEPMSVMWTPVLGLKSTTIPWTYCWSPTLIPKPSDWGQHISVAGFYFLKLASGYNPPQDLLSFLGAGPPPVYIGFGSIVVDDPNAMTKMIFEAVEKAGVRALVSKGWGGLGGDALKTPENVFMLGNVPHDWLFQHVSAVVHHGGAGTTAAGMACGKPTVVVPFFGDQPFWGNMIAKAGAGPTPIAFKDIDSDKLAEQITFALKPETLVKASELGERISQENGPETGAKSFQHNLYSERLRCAFSPKRAAVWRIRHSQFRLSAFAAVVLGNEGYLNLKDFKLNRYREYDNSSSPLDPISGGASAVLGTLASFAQGVAEVPGGIHRVFTAKATYEAKKHRESRSGTRTPPAMGITRSYSDDITRMRSSAASSDSEMDRPIRSETLHEDIKAAKWTAEVSGPRHRLSFHRDSFDLSESEREVLDEVSEISKHVGEEAHDGFKHTLGELARFPSQFTTALAKGFHNAPALFGDDTVREPEYVDGFQSGLKAAGKEFVLEMYDGVTGVVTQPIRGAKKEGVKGFVKGVGKGIGGLLLKPEAAILGVPAYTIKGLRKEFHKICDHKIEDRIKMARIVQGIEEWKCATEEEKQEVIDAWKAANIELYSSRKRYTMHKKQSKKLQHLADELPGRSIMGHTEHPADEAAEGGTISIKTECDSAADESKTPRPGQEKYITQSPEENVTPVAVSNVIFAPITASDKEMIQESVVELGVVAD